MLVGIISDTHGLLRPQAGEALLGSDVILHAGDIGKPEVLDELQVIAPLTVIRGNVDKWAEALPDTESIELEGRNFYIIHNVRELDFDPAEAGFDAVISGHSHKPDIHEENGVLYINPGSAGPRRFKLPVALARVRTGAGRLEPEIIELSV